MPSFAEYFKHSSSVCEYLWHDFVVLIITFSVFRCQSIGKLLVPALYIVYGVVNEDQLQPGRKRQV